MCTERIRTAKSDHTLHTARTTCESTLENSKQLSSCHLDATSKLSLTWAVPWSMADVFADLSIPLINIRCA